MQLTTATQVAILAQSPSRNKFIWLAIKAFVCYPSSLCTSPWISFAINCHKQRRQVLTPWQCGVVIRWNCICISAVQIVDILLFFLRTIIWMYDFELQTKPRSHETSSFAWIQAVLWIAFRTCLVPSYSWFQISFLQYCNASKRKIR